MKDDCPLMRLALRSNSEHHTYKTTADWMHCHDGVCCWWVDGLQNTNKENVGGMCCVRYFCIKDAHGYVPV